MFRQSALLFVALLCMADAQFEALTANKNKTGNKHPKGAHNDKTNLRKVTGFNLCTQEYDAYIGGTGVAGTGAFSYPVYPGDCAEVDDMTEEIGSLSATCSNNPYEGVTFTLTRQAVGRAALLDDIRSPGTNFNPTPPNQGNFVQDWTPLEIGETTTTAQVQASVDQFCVDQQGTKFAPFSSKCSAELRLSGDNRKNKHPGSILSFDFTTNTTLVPAGGTYTSITQYGMGGVWTTKTAGTGGGFSVSFAFVDVVELFAYQVIDTVTCVARPNTIDTTFSKIYGGSGRFEKYPASKVASVELDTILIFSPDDAANPENTFETESQVWNTQLEVNYAKKYLDSSML